MQTRASCPPPSGWPDAARRPLREVEINYSRQDQKRQELQTLTGTGSDARAGGRIMASMTRCEAEAGQRQQQCKMRVQQLYMMGRQRQLLATSRVATAGGWRRRGGWWRMRPGRVRDARSSVRARVRIEKSTICN